MYAEIIAIIGAVLFAVGHILVKKALSHSNPFTGTLITILSSTIMLWSIAIVLLPLHLFLSRYIFIFAIAGIFAPICGRFLVYTGISRLGISRSTPISNASPLFSSFLAIILMGEKMTLSILLGTLLVISGAILLSHEGNKKKDWRKLDLIFPFLAALTFGISYFFRKLGLFYIRDSLLGATVTSTSALLILLLIIFLTRLKHNLEINKHSFTYYFIAGFFYGGGLLLNYLSLLKGNVITVIPILHSNSFFAILLSYLFLKETDVITLKIVIGAIMVFLGIISIII